MEGRSRASAVACNGSLYFFGGYGTMNTYTGNSFRNDTFQYSLESQQWFRLECLGYFPKPRIHHSAVVKDHKMVIYGGINEDNMFLNDMFALSLRENPPTWKKVAMQVSTNHMSSSQINNPSAPFLCCHSAAVHPTRNSMVVFGGKIGGGLISPHLFEFSFATQEWSRLGSAAQPLSPSARLQAIDPVAPTEGPLLYNHSAAIINNTMYIYGGYTYHQGNHQTLNTMVFAFNFSILSWRTVYNPAALTRAVVPQDSFCMAVDAERMQLWSLGATSAYLQLNVPENSKVEWKTFNTISDGDGEKAYVPVLRDFPATVTCDHWVFLFGGERNNAAAHTPLGLDLSTDITRPDLNIADLQPQAFFSDLLSFNFDTQCWSCHNISEGPCDPSTDRPSTIFNALSQMDNLQYYATGQDPGQTSPSTMINTDQPEPWDAVEFKRQKFKSPIKRALLAPTGVEKTVTDNSSHVPIWKRETRPQKPDKAPDYDMYYETKPGPREQSRAGTESRRKVKVCRMSLNELLANCIRCCTSSMRRLLHGRNPGAHTRKVEH
jgi:hypothetical protein